MGAGLMGAGTAQVTPQLDVANGTLMRTGERKSQKSE